MRGRRGYSSSKPVTELAPPPGGPGAGVRTRAVTQADKAKAVSVALANKRLRITPGQARAITEGIHRPQGDLMTLATIVALIVLIVAVLVAVGFVPHTAPVVGLLIAALAAALLLGGVRL